MTGVLDLDVEATGARAELAGGKAYILVRCKGIKVDWPCRLCAARTGSGVPCFGLDPEFKCMKRPETFWIEEEKKGGSGE